MSATIPAWKLCSVRHYPPLFVGGLMSYLCYYFCLLHIVMSNTYWLYEQHGGCLTRGMNCLPFVSTWVFGGVRVAHLFSFLCCILFVWLRHVSCVPNVVRVSDCPFFFLTFIWKRTGWGFLCSHCGSHLLTFFHRKIFLWNSVVNIVNNYSKLIFFK